MSRQTTPEIGLFAPQILWPAARAAVRKLSPIGLARNPVIFATAMVVAVTTVLVIAN